MENASKALIIAGAILLAILIISLGILIYNQASGVVTNNSMDEVSIQTFNNKFLQYAGDQKGSAVRALLSQINASNATDGTPVEITPTWADGITESTIETGGTYYITIEMDSDSGLVDTITIGTKAHPSSTGTETETP